MLSWKDTRDQPRHRENVRWIDCPTAAELTRPKVRYEVDWLRIFTWALVIVVGFSFWTWLGIMAYLWVTR